MFCLLLICADAAQEAGELVQGSFIADAAKGGSVSSTRQLSFATA